MWSTMTVRTPQHILEMRRLLHSVPSDGMYERLEPGRREYRIDGRDVDQAEFDVAIQQARKLWLQ